MMEIYDCEQGTDEWFQVKLGRPSASSFSKIMAKGKGITRKNYLYKLAGEILTGKHQESYSNKHMEYGIEMEAKAREEYEFLTGVDVRQVGFIKDGEIGCSPDGLVCEDGGIEVKSVIPSVHIETVKHDKVPPEHKAQIQGCLMVSGREWWDFVSFDPRVKNRPFWKIRVHRDEEYIKELAIQVTMFVIELKKLIETLTVNKF